jgi:hypothetical protein
VEVSSFIDNSQIYGTPPLTRGLPFVLGLGDVVFSNVILLDEAVHDLCYSRQSDVVVGVLNYFLLSMF